MNDPDIHKVAERLLAGYAEHAESGSRRRRRYQDIAIQLSIEKELAKRAHQLLLEMGLIEGTKISGKITPKGMAKARKTSPLFGRQGQPIPVLSDEERRVLEVLRDVRLWQRKGSYSRHEELVKVASISSDDLLKIRASLLSRKLVKKVEDKPGFRLAITSKGMHALDPNDPDYQPEGRGVLIQTGDGPVMFARDISGGNLAVGDGATINIDARSFFELMIQEVDKHPSATDEEKEEAKGLIRRIAEHPLTAATWGAAMSALFKLG